MISSLDPEWIFYVTGNKFIPQAEDYSVRVVRSACSCWAEIFNEVHDDSTATYYSIVQKGIHICNINYN